MPDRAVDLGYLAKSITDLTDEEINEAFQIIWEAREKYKDKTATAANLASLTDEITTKCANKGILVTCSEAPMLNGDPFQVSIDGKIGPPNQPFDHEKKGYEVNKSKQRGEDWLGQKEPINKRREK